MEHLPIRRRRAAAPPRHARAMQAGKMDLAIQEARKALAIDPNNEWAKKALGR